MSARWFGQLACRFDEIPMRKLILIIPAALTPANISGPTGR